MAHHKEITGDAIHFSVEWRVNWGYHVFAHCPTCKSSFSSATEVDEWHQDVTVAMRNATDGLSAHVVEHHSPKGRRKHAPS